MEKGRGRRQPDTHVLSAVP